MPIFNFYGAELKDVKNFAQKVTILSENLKAPEAAFSFWNVNSQSAVEDHYIKIEVNWKKRGEEMKQWVSTFIQNYFSEINKDYKTIIIFTEIDDNYYKSGIKS